MVYTNLKILLGGRNFRSKIEMLLWRIQYLKRKNRSFIKTVLDIILNLNIKVHSGWTSTPYSKYKRGRLVTRVGGGYRSCGGSR